MEKRQQLNVLIDSRLVAALKKENERLGTKFNRYIESQLRNALDASMSVRKLGLERQ